jgi:hypothetical protein
LAGGNCAVRTSWETHDACMARYVDLVPTTRTSSKQQAARQSVGWMNFVANI